MKEFPGRLNFSAWACFSVGVDWESLLCCSEAVEAGHTPGEGMVPRFATELPGISISCQPFPETLACHKPILISRAWQCVAATPP